MTTTPQSKKQKLANLLERVWYQHETTTKLRRLDSENQRQRADLDRKSEAIQRLWTECDQLRAQVKQAELERDEAQTKCQELSAQLVEAGKNEDAWRAQLSKAVAEEREACALECESRQANGNRTHTHPDECAAAIRARSNT